MHDVVDPYPPSKPGDALELSLQRLEAEMERRRVADESVAAAVEILEHRAAKDPLLAAKQARLLALLRDGVAGGQA